ncbi:hypothetical protein ACM26V_06280 [Salipaludibacillus sp. HK11]|uniref:hypothetical protein n=1 Tax=Salipaludibacillus sp. HK11 TaxID=3394320 RepID=UPI0039FDDBE5
MNHLATKSGGIPTLNTIIIRGLGIICYITASLYLINHFFTYSWIVTLYSTLGALLLFFAIFSISFMNRGVVLVLVVIGTIIFAFENVPLEAAIHGFGENISLLSLFILIPLIGTFMSTAGYLTTLKEKVKLREKSGGKHPYRLSYILVATIGPLLNFGSLAIVKKIADESFSSFQERKMTLHMMRAFAFCMLWSPYFVNVGLVLVLFEVSWFDIGGFGFIFALIFMGISMVMLPSISFPEDPIVKNNIGETNSRLEKASLKPMVFFAAVLVVLSLVLDYVLDVNMLIVVSMLAVVLPVIWALFSRLFTVFIFEVYEQVIGAFSRFKNELAIFISAGYFGLALSYTDLGDSLSTLLFNLSFGFVYLFTLFVVVITIALALIGVHPIIIVIGVGSALSPEMFGVSSEYLALTLLLSWTLATQVSPFSGQVLMSSKLMKTSTMIIARENAVFVFVCFLILPIILFCFHFFGWI